MVGAVRQTLARMQTQRNKTNTLKRNKKALVATGLAGVSLQASAMEPEDVLHFRVGNVNIRPQFNTGVTYNDNIYFRSTDPILQLLSGPVETDVIQTVGTGLVVSTSENAQNNITFNYDYQHRFYTDHPEISSGDHTGGFQGTLTRGKVGLTGSHNMSYLTSIQGGGTTFSEQNDRFVLSDQLRLNLNMTAKSDVYVVGSYNSTDQDEQSRFADSKQWTASSGYGYKYSENLRMFSQLSYGKATTRAPGGFENSWNFTGGSIGAEGSFTDKLTGTVRFGYERRSSDVTDISAGSPTVTAELDQVLGDRSQASLIYTRSNQVNIDAFDSASVIDQVQLSLQHLFGARKKWIASVYGGFSKNNFTRSGGSAQNREDVRLDFGASVNYRIQEWLSSSLSYSFSSFSADFSSGPTRSIDYQVNRVNLSAYIGF